MPPDQAPGVLVSVAFWLVESQARAVCESDSFPEALVILRNAARDLTDFGALSRQSQFQFAELVQKLGAEQGQGPVDPPEDGEVAIPGPDGGGGEAAGPNGESRMSLHGMMKSMLG